MKKIITLKALLFVSLIFAQKTIEKSVGEFSELKVYDLIEVELIPSNDNKVIISGENKNDLVVNNKNGKLKIKMSFEEIFDGNKTKVKLYYTSVDVIDVNEGAEIFSNNKIKQFEIDLKAQEGGSINIPIKVDYLNVKAVTGGIIKVSGEAKKQDVSIMTGGVYKGADLSTENTEVSVNAAGEAHINASKHVDAKIRAGGDIYIHGDPEIVNESTVLGGRIKKVN